MELSGQTTSMKKILLTAVLIICCGLLETVEGTSIPECTTQRYTVEGLPSWLLLPLPINLWEEKSYVYVKRLGRNSSDEDVLVLDGRWNNSKKDVDVDITPRASRSNYQFGGFCDNKTLLLIITKMSTFHEGTYEVETNLPRDASKVKTSFCNLTMSSETQEPVLVDKETTTLPDQTTSTAGAPICHGPIRVIVENPSNSVLITSNIVLVVVLVIVIIFIVAGFIVWRWKPHYFPCERRTDEDRRRVGTSTMTHNDHATNAESSSCRSGDNDPVELDVLVDRREDPEHDDLCDVDLRGSRTSTEASDSSSERSAPQPC